MKSLMTIVVPCYNEEDALPLFVSALAPIRRSLSAGSFARPDTGEEVSFSPCDTEIVFVDDGSKDKTLSQLRDFHKTDPSVRYVSFSRNFGKEAAIYAGLGEAKGDYIVLMDADLQHPVEELPVMYAQLTSGRNEQNEPYDSIAMYRPSRSSEGRLRYFFSKRFFRHMNRLCKLDMVDGATDFRMMTAQMKDAVLNLEEYNRFTKGIFNWVGFSTCWMPYNDCERCAGKSKWTFRSLVRYAFEGMFAFSSAPLTISFSLGIILCALAIIYAVFTVVKTLIWGDPVAGFPSLFTMILLMGGVQLLFLGILGQYMSRMYFETKRRPVFIAKEKSE